MATNDWKAELKRRIQSIRERKQQDSDNHGENQPFQRSSVAPAPQPIEEKTSPSNDGDVENEDRTDVAQVPAPSDDDQHVDVPNTDAQVQNNQDSATTSLDMPISSSSERKPESRRTDRKNSDGLLKDKSEEEELTLFPVEPVAIKIDNEARANATERTNSTVSSNSKGTTAAPFDSEAEELLDSYVPLDSYSAQNSVKDKESHIGTEPYHPNRIQRRTNLLRVAAAITDLVILTASEAIIVWIASLLAETNPLNLLMNSIWSFGWLFIALHFVYYVLFTSTTGQTPGKSAFGLKVVRERPGTIGIGKGIARWLFMLLSFAPLAFGYIFLFFNRNGRSLYDLALGHQVRRIDR